MLNQVPQTINRLASQIVHNHPNSIGIQAFRKNVTRNMRLYGMLENGQLDDAAHWTDGSAWIDTETGKAPNQTLGGLGVMSSEDEDEISFDFLGLGSALPVATDFAPSPMNDNRDAPYSDGAEFRFLIEADAPTGAPGGFDVRKNDLILLWLMDDGSLKIPFEIVGTETVNNLPPFSVRFICNRRDDLLWAVNDLDGPAP